MIPQEKLDALSLPVLMALRDSVKQAIERKAKVGLRPGQLATFEHNGLTKTICIQKINPKTVGGYVVDAAGNHLKHLKWRVAPQLLTPVIPAAPKPVRPPGAGADRPSVAHAGW